MNNKKVMIFIGMAIGLAVALFGFYFYSQKELSVNLDSFAQCVAESKATMYGAYWCSHCQAQKKLFGNSFKFVPYVECTEKTAECIAVGVNGYPTWIFGDGRKVEGQISLEKISEFSGCPLSSPA